MCVPITKPRVPPGKGSLCSNKYPSSFFLSMAPEAWSAGTCSSCRLTSACRTKPLPPKKGQPCPDAGAVPLGGGSSGKVQVWVEVGFWGDIFVLIQALGGRFRAFCATPPRTSGVLFRPSEGPGWSSLPDTPELCPWPPGPSSVGT